jgi:hypothetical protein
LGNIFQALAALGALLVVIFFVFGRSKLTVALVVEFGVGGVPMLLEDFGIEGWRSVGVVGLFLSGSHRLRVVGFGGLSFRSTFGEI